MSGCIHASLNVVRSRVNDSYYAWLVGRLGDLSTDYDVILDVAHSLVFESFVPNDENRALDGLALRDAYGEVALGTCTVLEMMIGVATRMNDILYDFEDPDRIGYYFCDLIDNLGLFKYRTDADYIRGRLLNVVDREYAADGTGGLFPLDRTEKDQREVEIWYQMMEFIMENR